MSRKAEKYGANENNAGKMRVNIRPKSVKAGDSEFNAKKYLARTKAE